MNNSLGLEFLSPNQPIGFLILISGMLFTVFIFYIFINLNKESEEEAKRRKKEELIQKNKIDRLYP